MIIRVDTTTILAMEGVMSYALALCGSTHGLDVTSSVSCRDINLILVIRETSSQI